VIREKEEVPSDWREGYLIKLDKKRDLSNRFNYRGITLLSVHGKALNRIIELDSAQADHALIRL